MKIIQIALLFFTFSSSFAAARPKTHDAAVSILGQVDFTSDVEFDPPTNRSLMEVEGVAVDPTTGKLFISDSSNNRILRFSSTAAYQTNAAAEAVFGQADFNSNLPNRGAANPAADSLDYPATITVDGAGRLWVCDYDNARVLRFDDASSKPSSAAADGVIGLGGFTAATQAVNSDNLTGFGRPTGIAVTADGTLWVSDAALFRILRFDNAASLPAVHLGAANGFLGTIDTGVFISGTSDSAFAAEVWGLASDLQGRLWVADPTNHRVLCFFDPANKSSADLVLGQADFDSSALPEPPTASSMNNPFYVTVAPDGTAWISDFENHRVIGFSNAAALDNGDAADIVLGQPDFVTAESGGGYTARKTINPTQIAIGRGGSLFIGEYSPPAHVKRWSDPVSITAPKAVTTKKTSAKIKGTSAGATSVSYKIAGQKGSKLAGGSPAAWSLVARKLTKKKTNVTVTATAFDGRTARAIVKVIKKAKKKR